MDSYDVDVAIIGAGPSGTTAATLLSRAQYKTVVLEKSAFPRFVIGESLLPRCMDLLEEAGMLEDVKARGYMIKNGAVFMRNDKRCMFDFSEQHTEGWNYTYQVPRDDFDMTLARTAEKQGVTILWHHTVEDVEFEDNAVILHAMDNDQSRISVNAKFILDGSGYGRVLPRLLNLEEPSSLEERQSIFTHITGDLRPDGDDEGKIWICILPDNSWLWVIPFSNGKTSVGLVARPGFIEKLPGESLDDKLKGAFTLEQNAAKRLCKSDFQFPVQSIRGYSAAVTRFAGQGYALLGNATEFLDPVFSSGVTLALESANRAANILIRQLDGEKVDWQREYSDYMTLGVETFRTYVNAWYEDKLPVVFFSKNQPPTIRKQICSVLAGYVWDLGNPCVKEHKRAVSSLAAACTIQQQDL